MEQLEQTYQYFLELPDTSPEVVLGLSIRSVVSTRIRILGVLGLAYEC